MLLGSTKHGGALLGPLSPPPPSCPPPLLLGWMVDIFTLGDTKSPAQAEPGSRVLMQGAEQQKAETTTLERELPRVLGWGSIAHIYWVYTATTSISAG